ncbi:MAG: MEKHLA domain-containing protein [Candidatus Contendobacter sp.]|nr:MEKHLA domain-containing protein [Candidatus Contendobacter sp.]MDS4060129.1 MEKHLA domain-containing protein [Candidatus Contendobacter sp.]
MSATCPTNHYRVEHTELLRRAFHALTGRDLIDPTLSPEAAAEALFHAPFVVLSHDTAPDPILTYGNAKALELFELTWEELTRMPSRHTAEAPDRAERERLLARVAAQGFIDDYSGVRISRTGQRFLIERATVWNLTDAAGQRCGQAATFREWRYLENARLERSR